MNAIAANLFAVMTVAMVKFDNRKNNDKGAAMVEYALLVAGVAVVVGAAVLLLGGQISTKFGEIGSKLAGTPATTGVSG